MAAVIQANIRPTIIIGVGGVGKNILLRIRRKVVEEYRSLDVLPSLRFLHIDTFQDGGPEVVQDITSLIVLGENISFKPYERVIISNAFELKNPALVKKNPSVKAWFFDDLSISDVVIELGAGSVRPYGRLAFHYSVDDFRVTLEQAIGDALKSENWDRTAATLNINPDLPNTVDVYVVSSFFGGTGSGCFYEVCYNTRHVLGNMALNHLLLGFFVIGASNPDDVMKANCYAALKELQHYSTVPFDSSLSPFNVEYPIAGPGPLNSNSSPVDFCFLFDSQNRVGQSFNREKLEEAVAARIFFEFVPGIASQLRARRVDVTAGTDGFITPDSVLKKAQTFFGTGVSVIEYPVPRIKNALAYSLSADVCLHLLFQNAPGLSDSYMGIFIRNNGLTEDGLISYLRPGKNTVDNDLFNARQNINNMIDVDDKEKFNETAINNTIDVEKEGAKAKVDLNKPGPLIRNIRNAKEKKLDLLKNSITDEITQWVCKDDTVGPGKTKEFLGKVIGELNNLKNRFGAQVGGFDANINKSSGRVQDRRFRIKEDMNYKYRWELKKHVKWLFEKELKDYMYHCLDKSSYQEGESLVAELIQFLKGQVEKIESYERKLNGWIEEFEGRIDDISENLSQAKNIVDIPGSSDKIKDHIIDLKKKVIPDGVTSITQIIRDVQGEDRLGANPFVAALEKEKEFKEQLLSECEGRFDSVDNTSVAPFLDGNLVNNKSQEGRALLRVEGLDMGTSHITRLNQRRWAMVPPGSGAHFPAGYNVVGANPPYRAIFAEEMAVFPLRCLAVASNPMSTYKRAYDKSDLTRRGTDKRIKFDDIAPLDIRIPKIYKKAKEAYHQGRALELLQESKKDGFPAIYLRYHDRLGEERWEEIYVVQRRDDDPWEKVEEILAETQVDKDVNGKITGDTHLEILEKEIASEVGKATSSADRQKISNALQRYQDAYLDGQVQMLEESGRLDNRIRELIDQGISEEDARDGALKFIKGEANRNASYQKIVDIFSQFRFENNLP